MYIDLAEQMKKNKTTRYRICKNTGIYYPSLNNIFKHTTESISFDVLEKLCIELHCTPNDLLVFGDPPADEYQDVPPQE
jgi:putative transcriptional regulator